MKPQDLIMDLVVQTANLPDFYSDIKLDSLLRSIKLVIRKVFGDNSYYFKDLEEITFVPPRRPAVSSNGGSRTTSIPTNVDWKRGVGRVENLLTTMLKDINLSSIPITEGETTAKVFARKVFIVHGHDEEMKQSVARVLSQLEMEPIILHEQANKGRTLIEKFDQHADVGFAIVLLSPDDVGRKKGTEVSNDKDRARQNVVFELGYFIGRLGRERVIPLLRSSRDFEKPTDIDGVAYVSYDDRGAWRFEVVKELKACNYAVDANHLLGR